MFVTIARPNKMKPQSHLYLELEKQKKRCSHKFYVKPGFTCSAFKVSCLSKTAHIRAVVKQ